MKHTEVYGLRNKGTRDAIKGTLASMEAGGEEAHGLHATPLGTPLPDEVCLSEAPNSSAFRFLGLSFQGSGTVFAVYSPCCRCPKI